MKSNQVDAGVFATVLTSFSIVSFFVAGMMYRQSVWSLQILQLVSILPNIANSYANFSLRIGATHAFGTSTSLQACIANEAECSMINLIVMGVASIFPILQLALIKT